MPEPVVEIPDRPVFRASEVCEIAQIPAYVLRSWEKEFPGLGTEAKPGGARVYRRADVEQVLRIKHLLFAEGLTLAGARRKLEGEAKPEEEPFPDLPLGGAVRERVSRVKRELRSLLDLLSSPPAAGAGVSPAPIPPPGSPATPDASPAEGLPGPRPAEDAAGAPWPPSGASADSEAEGAAGSSSDLPLIDGVVEKGAVKGHRPPRRSPRRPAGAA